MILRFGMAVLVSEASLVDSRMGKMDAREKAAWCRKRAKDASPENRTTWLHMEQFGLHKVDAEARGLDSEEEAPGTLLSPF